MSRAISNGSVALITVTIILGSGLFSLPSVVAQFSASSTQFLALWIAGGVLSFIGLLTYAELAHEHPYNGGDAVYLSKELHPRLGVLFLVAECLVIRPGAIAVLVETASLQFMPASLAAELLLPLGLLMVATGLQLIRRDWNLTLSGILSALKILMVLACILSPLLAGQVVLDSASTESSISSLAIGLALTLFVYGGWNEVTYMMAEVREGSRGYLRGAALGLLIITIVYLMVAVTLVGTLTLKGLQVSESPFQTVIAHSLGAVAGTIAAGIIALCCIGSAHGVSLAGIPLYALFSQKILRSERISPGAFQFAVAATVLLMTREIKTALLYTTPIVWSFAICSAIAAMRIVKRRHGVATLRMISPAIFLVVATGLSYQSIDYDPKGSVVGFAVLFFGFIALLAAEARAAKHPL